MEHLNLNRILDRECIIEKIKTILQEIDKTKCNDHQIKKDFTFMVTRVPEKQNL